MERWAEPPATRQCRRRGALVQLYSALAATQLPASALLYILYTTIIPTVRYNDILLPGIQSTVALAGAAAGAGTRRIQYFKAAVAVGGGALRLPERAHA